MPKKTKPTNREEQLTKAAHRLKANLKFYWRTRWQHGDNVSRVAAEFDTAGNPVVVVNWK